MSLRFCVDRNVCSGTGGGNRAQAGEPAPERRERRKNFSHINENFLSVGLKFKKKKRKEKKKERKAEREMRNDARNDGAHKWNVLAAANAPHPRPVRLNSLRRADVRV